MVPITIGTMNHLIPTKPPPQPPTFAANGVVRAQDLMGTSPMLVIEHESERYLLRRTKNGKLILTK